MKPLPSSISLRLQSRPTGRYSPSALRATGTAPTRAFLPLPATLTLSIFVCWQRTASSPRLSCPRPRRWVPSITVRSTSSGPWCSIKRLTACWLPPPRPMRLSVRPRAAGSRTMPSSWPLRPSRSRPVSPTGPTTCAPGSLQLSPPPRHGWPLRWTTTRPCSSSSTPSGMPSRPTPTATASSWWATSPSTSARTPATSGHVRNCSRPMEPSI